MLESSKRKDAWLGQTQAAGALEQVIRLAGEHGIDVLPVKGIVTGHTLYADPAERTITDLDLRVRRGDVERLRRAAHGAGWREVVYSRAYENLVFLVGDWMVDVEATVGPPGLCALTVDAMIERASWETEPFGFRHRRPEFHDHALVLCVNAFKDKLVEANERALGDLERLVGSPAFDAGTLAERAREGDARTIVWFVADWMARTRGATGWRRVEEALGAEPRPAYTWLLRRAIENGSRSLAARILARAAADSPRRRAQALWTLGRYQVERLASRSSR